MARNAHMVDLLRPELSFDGELRNLLYKSELTQKDFNTIIEKAEQVKNAAKEARKQRFGK
jgi:ornithine carbamoyltransferase